MKIHSIIIVAVLGVCAYVFFRRHKSPDRKVQIASRPALIKSEPKAKRVFQLAALPPPAAGEVPRNIAQGLMYSPTPNNAKLNVKFKVQSQWCRSGDFDTLKAVTDSLSHPEYVLALESLGNRSSPITRKLSLNEMLSGKNLVFAFPAFSDPELYSIGLCRGSAGSSCVQSEPWSPSQSLDVIARKKVLLFNVQLLVRTSRGFILLPSGDWSDEHREHMKDMLQGLGVTNFKLDQVFDKIAVIRPLPARLNQDGVQIPLRYNDPKCFEKSPVGMPVSR